MQNKTILMRSKNEKKETTTTAINKRRNKQTNKETQKRTQKAGTMYN